MKKRPSREVRALARRAADVAAQAQLDGLDAARAVMAAAIHIAFDARMSAADIADWLRRLAEELDQAAEADAARVRELLRQDQITPTKGA
jgi:hypothetical protein